MPTEAEEGDASSAEEGGASAGGSRGAARRRMMWTPELHARFMNAVNSLVRADDIHSQSHHQQDMQYINTATMWICGGPRVRLRE